MVLVLVLSMDGVLCVLYLNDFQNILNIRGRLHYSLGVTNPFS